MDPWSWQPNKEQRAQTSNRMQIYTEVLKLPRIINRSKPNDGSQELNLRLFQVIKGTEEMEVWKYEASESLLEAVVLENVKKVSKISLQIILHQNFYLTFILLLWCHYYPTIFFSTESWEITNVAFLFHFGIKRLQVWIIAWSTNKARDLIKLINIITYL